MALLTLLAALAGWMRWLSGVPTASAASSSDTSGVCTALYDFPLTHNLTKFGGVLQPAGIWQDAGDGASALHAMVDRGLAVNMTSAT